MWGGLRAAMLGVAWLVGAAPTSAQTLRIFHSDVEQADATLFVLPSGKTLLVDSGKNDHGPRIHAVIKEAGVSPPSSQRTRATAVERFGVE